jgi:hypothetical protein
MMEVRAYLLTKTTFAVLTLLVVIGACMPGFGQKSTPANVKVVNTTSEPVPVTGNVTASVSGNVTIGNTVPVTGAVAVSNSESSPLIIRDLDRATLQPFVVTMHFGDSFTVPQNKILVLEYVSGFIDTTASAPEPYFFTYPTAPDGVSSPGAVFVPASRFSDDPSFRRWIFNSETKAYFKPGQRVYVYTGPSLNGQFSSSLTIIGHYVNTP